MQHCHEQHPFHREREPPARQQPLDRVGNSQLLPEAAEHERRPDAPIPHRRRVPGLVSRDHHRLLGELGARLQKRVELTTLAQVLDAAERGDHLLSRTTAFPAVLDDLQIHAVA
jgi:hypothetical protein